jgi:hypothetical protein
VRVGARAEPTHLEHTVGTVDAVRAVATVLALSALLVTPLALAPTAGASQPLGDAAGAEARLAVDASGVALVSYRSPSGRERRVLAWGAINARQRSAEVRQERFTLDYSGGLVSRGRAAWKTFRNQCLPYDGPALPLLVSACRAPDGTYWALQIWQRRLPMRGVEPWRPDQGALELHLSHWSGSLPALEVSPNWTYGGRWQGLFGRLTYEGAPVFGFRTPSSRHSDPFARYVYIDTLDSVYGAGWRHDAGKVLHQRNGAFCYSFVPQPTPRHYPVHEVRGPGNGRRHRVTVMGPGVTPVVQWEGDGLGPFDASRDGEFNTLFDRVVGPDDLVCRNER